MTAPSTPPERKDEPTTSNLPRPLASLKEHATSAAHHVVAASARTVLQQVSTPHDADLAPVHADAAFNPTRVREESSLQQAEQDTKTSPQRIRSKARAHLTAAATAVAHPRRTAKEQAKRVAAGRISRVQKPHDLPVTSLGLKGEEICAEAADGTISGNRTEAKEDEETERMEAFLEQREGLRVVWAMAHVRHARVVPKGRLSFPRAEDFTERSGEGKEDRFAWEKWLGHVGALSQFSRPGR